MKNNIKKAPVKFWEDLLYFQHFMQIFVSAPVIITTLRSILYSESEESYNKRHERLMQEFSFFTEYDNDNWHICRQMWVRCYQKDAMSFGNFTNNKIESHNEKIKQYLTPKMHIPESVENLIRAVKDTYDRSAYNNFLKLKTRIDTSSKDDVRNKYALLCVPSAFEIIRSELIKVYSEKHEVMFDKDCVTVSSVSDSNGHKVNEALTPCSCTINCIFLPTLVIMVFHVDISLQVAKKLV